MRTFVSVTSAIILLILIAVAPAIAQQGSDEIEPNDSKDTADTAKGLEIVGEIGLGDDIDDWYELDGQEGYYPRITLFYDNENCDVDLEIYSGEEIIGYLDSVESPDSNTFAIADVCYLHVIVYDGHGEYTINIVPRDDADECQGENEIESNNEREISDPIEELKFSGYACEDDDDWFVLDGDEGANPTITLTYDVDQCDIDLDVYSGDEYIGTLDDHISPDSNTFEVPDACYLHVFAFEGEGEYTIEIKP